MKYLFGIFFSFLFLFSGCTSKPLVLDIGFEKLKNYTEFNQLSDAVPVYFEDYAFILTNPTDKYKHGILGDFVEGETLTFFNSERIIHINFSPQVFEGLFPLVYDNLIISTLSGDSRGAQIVGFDFNGDRVFSSSSLSSGWRHVLGFEGDVVIDVVMPHVRGELEMLEIRGDELIQISSLIGYSTHKIGSRNLNIYEFYQGNYLILPTFDFNSVAIVSIENNELVEVFRLDIGEEVISIENIYGEIFVNSESLNIREILK